MVETTNRAGAIATLRRDGRLLHDVVFALLVVPGVATAAACGAQFRYPTPGLQFYRRDTINVTYQSSFSQPTLSLLCGDRARPSEKFRLQTTTPASSALVPLNFSSPDPCWFHLEPQTGECGGDSPSFALVPGERPGSSRTTIGLLSSTAAIAPRTATAIATKPEFLDSTPSLKQAASTQTGTVAPSDPPGGQDLSPGAKAGIGIGIALLIAAGAMAAFMYFRRRKKGQDSDLGRAIRGRKPEKSMGRNGASSVNSGRSDEPLNPIVDGFPGSMGYDDARSMHSLHSIDTHNTHNTYQSPSTGYSPNIASHNGGYWTERDELQAARGFWTDRDELTAARLKSQPIPIVTSYGPNPVTPTLTPRASSRADLNARAASISIDSREGIPPMPAVPFMPDFTDYTMPAPPKPRTSVSPPRKAAAPIIVSYGPNRVTPTPAVTTPTVPPDETIFQRSKDPVPVTLHDRQFSWEDSPIEPMAPSAMGPLPPYASSAEYIAMEKGAIRKLETPQAQAELPPTKDGYYHGYTSDIVEYSELPGATRHNEPQLPHHIHPYKRHPEAGPSSGVGLAGPSGSGGMGLREIDEQKFLLLPEISNLRAQKKKQQRRDSEEEDEEYDLGESRRR
ncbi:hypothetical protein QBC34DRAFT_426372 [Podospora aff. communis PSN243]|uniref:Uncharacterized protein n=1 Tax=Podospora aff. communis PSN243 TaxID=3040156 RepID=A0AAV9GMD7_9PEZI|nr:hypothetical protein QBC34DRAFT_426372 [Podospora aff. communis PSN243]